MDIVYLLIYVCTVLSEVTITTVGLDNAMDLLSKKKFTISM